ncbi:MAG: dockerin type I repeat-containing protein [Clostridiales bacterium]|nr:dockerin type I repeat-containing protein [Clostridiales bacterium]
MKRLILVLIIVCMALTCVSVVASAEKKDDYSGTFFEHMKEYIEMNEYHQGLVKSSYELLGDTSNGYHIAYCSYHYGDNVDIDFEFRPRFEYNGYVIDTIHYYCHKPSKFGIYCFDSENCYTIENAYEKNIIPLDEATKIINKSPITAYKKAGDDNDYSDTFFELMREDVNTDPLHRGLITTSYKYLGDLSNGYHVAYCGYYHGDDADVNWSSQKHIQIGDYLLVGKGYKYEPATFRLYCFDSNHCTSVEQIFTLQTGSDRDMTYWEHSVPISELIKLLNKTDMIYVYHKNELTENDKLSVFFNREMIQARFAEYLKAKYNYTEDSACEIYGKYKDYYIFFGAEDICSPAFETEIIDGYAVVSANIYYPYHLGIYALDGEKIYTLEEAVKAGLFKMSDIADMIDVKPLGDANRDGIVNLTDVTRLQRVVARLEMLSLDEYIRPLVDIDQDYELTMYDTVLIQRIIAKL